MVLLPSFHRHSFCRNLQQKRAGRHVHRPLRRRHFPSPVQPIVRIPPRWRHLHVSGAQKRQSWDAFVHVFHVRDDRCCEQKRRLSRHGCQAQRVREEQQGRAVGHVICWPANFFRRL